MSSLFDKSKKFAQPVERKYGNPFRKTPGKLDKLAKWEFMAKLIKKRGSPNSVKEIATELFDAEENAKKL